MELYVEYDRELAVYTDDVVELLTAILGGQERCRRFFNTARINELYDFIEREYQRGSHVNETARRYLNWYPEVHHFHKTGEVKLPRSFKKPKPEAPYMAARRKRKAQWEGTRI